MDASNGAGGKEKCETVAIYDVEIDKNSGDLITPDESEISEVMIYHSGELDNMLSRVAQEKDELHILYIPYNLVQDNELLTEWNE